MLALSTLKQVMEEKVRVGGWGGGVGSGRVGGRVCEGGGVKEGVERAGSKVGGGRRGGRRGGARMGEHPTTLRAACDRPAPLRRPPPGAQVTPTNVDIAKVAPAWHLYTPEEVEAVIARL